MRNDYRVIYTLENGTVLERTVSRTQATNLLVRRLFNQKHCSISVYDCEGELIGEHPRSEHVGNGWYNWTAIFDAENWKPAEYRRGWYNSELTGGIST